MTVKRCISTISIISLIFIIIRNEFEILHIFFDSSLQSPGPSDTLKLLAWQPENKQNRNVTEGGEYPQTAPWLSYCT